MSDRQIDRYSRIVATMIYKFAKKLKRKMDIEELEVGTTLYEHEGTVYQNIEFTFPLFNLDK